jgi:predicted outer membrane repeat protein
VIIQGAGAATTIIERDPNATVNFRLLAIVDQFNGSLILNDITLRGGKSDGDGGALYTFDRPTTLNNVELTGNIAPSGGAVAGVFLTVNNSTFTSNRATAVGGAIYTPILTVSGSTFTGNKAGTGGGAIFFTQSAGANFTITDSTFVNNSATTNDGGAIWSGGIASITGCTFDGNTADGEGGAIRAGRSLYISDSVIINNHANDIGGIAVEPSGEGFNSWMSVNRCNISHNTSNRRAGGLLFGGGVQNFTASISNSTISGNTAGLQGGGIFISDAAVTLSNVTVDGNTATDLGGGIFFQSDPRQLTVNNVTITGNRSTNNQGGGLFVGAFGVVNLKNSLIALNTAPQSHRILVLLRP